MKWRCFFENLPKTIEKTICPNCGDVKIPYSPDCLCGYIFFNIKKESNINQYTNTIKKEEKTIRIAHLSDLHVGAKTQYGYSAIVQLHRVFESIKSLDVDMVIISGDISETGSEEELLSAKNIFDNYGYGRDNRIIVPGNHDMQIKKNGKNFYEIFEIKYPYIQTVTNGVCAVVFDSNILEKRLFFEKRWVRVRGLVGEDAISIIRKELERNQDSIRLMILHHHIARLTPESRWSAVQDKLFKSDRKLMVPLLDAEGVMIFAKSEKISAILHGHKHWYSRTGYCVDGIPVFNAGSITHSTNPKYRIFDFKDHLWTSLYRVELTTL